MIIAKGKSFSKKSQYNINRDIRSDYVRVIGSDGKMLGILPTHEAIRLAESQGMDLVEFSPNNDPPVCKIIDFSRFLYEKKRKQQEAKKKQHKVSVRQIRMTIKIGDNDYNVKLKKIRKFLTSKDRVKVIVMLRGREILHKSRGIEIIERIKEDVSDIAQLESAPKLEGSGHMSIQALFLPKK